MGEAEGFKNIVILTGAGISAESGIETFRDTQGLWNNVDPYEVCSIEGYLRNPRKVNEFFNDRRQTMKRAIPNAAHIALAELENKFEGSFNLITQNIDPLHEKAGSKNIIHVHGEVLKCMCQDCGYVGDVSGDIDLDDICPECESVGDMRPRIVFFGEMPYEFDHAIAITKSCDLFIAIGTSGTVYPAADLVGYAKYNNAKTVCVNMDETAPFFDIHVKGLATESVKDLVLNILLYGKV